MKRLVYCTATTLVIALLFAGVLWVRERQEAAKRLKEWQAEQEEDAIPPVLSREFDWERADFTVAEFANLVAAKSDLKVELDEVGVGADGSRKRKIRDVLLHVPQGNFPLDVMLRMTLSSKGLCADVLGQKLLITTAANSAERTRLRTAVYPLPPLKPEKLDEKYWAKIVAANIDGHAEAVPGAIIVVASALGQRRVRLVIDTISRLNAAPSGPVAIPPAPLSAAESRVRAALDGPARLDVVEMPLKDLVLHLVASHGIPLILMADKVEEASIGLDTPITKSLKDISLRSLLALMLDDLELTYVVRDEAIVITTQEDVESRPQIVAYPVQDLTQVSDGPVDADSLVELLSRCIPPDSWQDGSGPGPLEVTDGWLLLEHTDPVHEEVAGLLAAIRRVLRSADHVETQPTRMRTEAERKVRAALERPIELDFKDVPLKDVVLHLQKLLDIPIVLSLRKLEEASISADTPIALKLPARRARDQLEQLLKEQQLDFVIRHEVLQITTLEDAESQVDTRVYDTRQLIGQRMSADQLCALIRTQIQPTSWDLVGGPGALEVYRDLLAVMQTERVHEEIEKLLATLQRRERPEKP